MRGFSCSADGRWSGGTARPRPGRARVGLGAGFSRLAAAAEPAQGAQCGRALLHQREDAHLRRTRGVTALWDAEAGPWAAPGRCSDAQAEDNNFADCARLVGGRRGCRSTTARARRGSEARPGRCRARLASWKSSRVRASAAGARVSRSIGALGSVISGGVCNTMLVLLNR